MTDIVERLRYRQKHGLLEAVNKGMYCTYGEAAEEIERLREAISIMADQIATLEAVARRIADEMSDADEIDTEDWQVALRDALYGEKDDG